MRIYFDTEFIEDGRTIDLLSIGFVREDGQTYYAEAAETDRSRASEWVAANVLPHLTGPVKPRAQIAREVVEFAGPSPEFWAWYADYDWVALCQLFGTMMDLPSGWPMFCRDYRQVTDGASLPQQDEQDGPEHNALSDARWLARAVSRHDPRLEEWGPNLLTMTQGPRNARGGLMTHEKAEKVRFADAALAELETRFVNIDLGPGLDQQTLAWCARRIADMRKRIKSDDVVLRPGVSTPDQ